MDWENGLNEKELILALKEFEFHGKHHVHENIKWDCLVQANLLKKVLGSNKIENLSNVYKKEIQNVLTELNKKRYHV